MIKGKSWKHVRRSFRGLHGLFLRPCVCVRAQSHTTLCDPIDYSLPGSSVHGILQARILQWVAISFSKGSSQPRDWSCISCGFCINWQIYLFINHWATLEALQNFWEILWATVVVLVAQLCLTLCDPMYYSPPGFSVLGNLHTRILEKVDPLE